MGRTHGASAGRRRFFGTGFFASVLLLACLFLPAYAAPIKPNIEQVLDQAERRQPGFVSARAGWNGPESAKIAPRPFNPMLEALKPENIVRRNLATLFAIALPDWRIWSLIALTIVWLRVRRKRLAHGSQQQPSGSALLLTMQSRTENDLGDTTFKPAA